VSGSSISQTNRLETYDSLRFERPLKIRADIRDLWISPNSPLQELISLLTSTLGHKIEAQVQWSSLYNALKSVYEEKSKFVPAVAQVTIAFYGRLLSRIENEANSEWTEQLLTEMAKEPGRTWQLNIEVWSRERWLPKIQLISRPQATGGSIRRPRLTLKLDVGAFFVEFPNKDLPMQAEIDAGFDHDLDSLFTPSTLASDGLNDDEWAEVTEVETYTSKTQPTIITAPALIQTAAPPTIPKLPAADTLLRPTELFKTTVPYNLIVDAASSPLTVLGSHQPSLELIASYLKKWTKINAHDSLKVSGM